MNTATQRLPIFSDMSALSDLVRTRILVLLEGHELTVSELCAVLQLPQSTTSRHLKILGDAGWVRSRPDGTRRLYRMSPEIPASSRQLWNLIRPPVQQDTTATQDGQRLKGVLERRRRRSQEFFSSAAGEWDRLRDELFGQRFLLYGLVGLLDDDWTIGDLGCGTGRATEAIAPFVGHVIAVDDSAAMLDAARARLHERDNVDLRRGRLEELPIEDGRLDAATLVLVLHHVADPALVLGEVARVLRPGGRLLLVDMLPHDRDEYRERMGHIWAGFTREQIADYAGAAGFSVRRLEALPAAAEARGPVLFAASLCKLKDTTASPKPSAARAARGA
jgi:ArsR family transcriptional regulator